MTVATQAHTLVDGFAAALPSGFLECARKHRQVLDAVFPLSLIIEKGLDCMSQACIAQQDIKQYYEHLSALKIARWLHEAFTASFLYPSLPSDE